MGDANVSRAVSEEKPSLVCDNGIDLVLQPNDECNNGDQRLDLSLNSYLAPERCDRKSIPQSEDGFPSLWKDGTCNLDEFIRKNAEAISAANLNPLAFSGQKLRGERLVLMVWKSPVCSWAA
ncbi:PREDICTED: EMBRYONIC FLOWER 1 [Prunus dulcis]|uniref:PREDICTED: EMBRYONIC FLOWER 1 n=1 Tax=Prunus dulcis TaxID=3755 RepID=A0A5E4EN18_PRUDU|nr:hypothetical protein L3X38_002450 [Prunus dulcis]VVA16822.1 PREDICTED: EMBRYONIC FLOWER 1 [Prunus dulcis]